MCVCMCMCVCVCVDESLQIVIVERSRCRFVASYPSWVKLPRDDVRAIGTARLGMTLEPLLQQQRL